MNNKTPATMSLCVDSSEYWQRRAICAETRAERLSALVSRMFDALDGAHCDMVFAECSSAKLKRLAEILDDAELAIKQIKHEQSD
jgi:hypothetical protein